MFTKEFLQKKVQVLLHDFMKDELFPTSIGLVMPISKTNKRTKTWSITALVTDLSQEDRANFSVENIEYKTVDIFDEDLETLKTDNPTAYIITKNFKKKNVQIVLDGADFKIKEEKAKEGFEVMTRFICEKQVM